MIGVVVGFLYSNENWDADVADETESARETLSDSALSWMLRGVAVLVDSAAELVESRRDSESRNECCMSDLVILLCGGGESSWQQSQQPYSQHVSDHRLSNNFLAVFWN